MKLTQVKGNTYVLEAWELIPLYKTDDTHCILLDSGLKSEREELEASLAEYGLTPIGVLSSHAHLDHAVNNRYFQEKYAIPAALPQGEAALCTSLLTLKCYYYMHAPAFVRSIAPDMIQKDVLPIGAEDGPFELAGVTFRIIHTPGHAPDHISVITPDNVCYVGDAILSPRGLKLPYAIAYGLELESVDKLKQLDCSAFILAHREVLDEIGPTADLFRDLILRVAEETFSIVTHPMTEDQVCTALCERLQLLSSRPGRAMGTARNVHALLEFLMDRGDVTVISQRGVRYYIPSRDVCV